MRPQVTGGAGGRGGGRVGVSVILLIFGLNIPYPVNSSLTISYSIIFPFYLI